jgi:amidohydrolase
MFERAKRFAIVLSALLIFAGNRATAQKVVVADPALAAEIDRRTAAIADKVTGWRHDIHQHPELGYAEKRTSALVAAHLRSLGIEVQENVGGIPVSSECSREESPDRRSPCAPRWMRCR